MLIFKQGHNKMIAAAYIERNAVKKSKQSELFYAVQKSEQAKHDVVVKAAHDEYAEKYAIIEKKLKLEN